MWIPEAISGVDESASYTWTGTHDFTGATVSMDTVTWTGTHDFSGSTFTVASSFTSGTDTVDFATGAAEDEILTYNAVTSTWGSEPAAAGVTIGTLNTYAKFAAADLADGLLSDDGTDITLATGSEIRLDDGSHGDDSIVFGASQDASIYYTAASGFTFDTNNGVGYIYFDVHAGYTIDMVFGTVHAHIWKGGAYKNQNMYQIAATLSAQDGSDINRGIYIDLINGAHTGSGNFVNLFEFDAFTGDADSTENIFALGDGPDYFIYDMDSVALGTLTWTTNSDKDANTAAGTIKVWINGALYHIQLYADS